MVSIVDVVKAINKQLKESFPTIKIQSTDVKEGYKRPCFYVDVVDFDSEMLMESYDHKTAAFSVYYFPSDPHNYRLELLEVREKLQDSFMGVLDIVEGFKIHILDTATSINDGVLSFDFEIEYYKRREEKDYPLIEGVEIDNL